MPSVTFVIATYRRVDALRSTLRSVRRQEHTDWAAIVVGDRCGEETAAMLRAFNDPRIRYYNLPERFGEQSGPNSAGLHLAGGDFVVFLNHDDLLLPDHLAHALRRIEEEAADFCFGRFATATRLGTGPDGTVVPVFTDVGPLDRDLGVLLRANPWVFDPSSFWVIRTPYAKAVGGWRSARTLWRPPIRDWLMRAWRLGGRFCFGTRVTGLRFLTRTTPSAAPLYATATPEHEHMAERIERETPDAIRALVREHLRAELGTGRLPRAAGHGRPAWRRALGRGRRRVSSWLYLRAGLDTHVLLARITRHRGDVLEKLSRKRTGEPLPPRPSLDAFLEDPDAHRVL